MFMRQQDLKYVLLHFLPFSPFCVFYLYCPQTQSFMFPKEHLCRHAERFVKSVNSVCRVLSCLSLDDVLFNLSMFQ